MICSSSFSDLFLFQGFPRPRLHTCKSSYFSSVSSRCLQNHSSSFSFPSFPFEEIKFPLSFVRLFADNDEIFAKEKTRYYLQKESFS